VTLQQIRVAALQIEAEVGNLDANLELCERYANRAAAAGAEWIVLPEFFSSGVAYRPELAQNAPPPDGAPTLLLQELAHRHGAHVGGSTLVRDEDGHVRNAFFLAGPDGELRGRHDKDMPTMWESALYIGGGDPGRIEAGGLTAGVALCWELMRTQTVERLAGKVDLVLSGSGWWSIPPWPPRALTRRLQAANARRAQLAPSAFARYVGVPVVHAAHSGTLNCPWPLLGFSYHGHYEGGASICGADGQMLAFRGREDGPGFAIATIEPQRRRPSVRPPAGFWLQRRGTVAALAWAYQNPHGRREYRRTRAQQPLAPVSLAQREIA
jgi:predicted amidohydrolase